MQNDHVVYQEPKEELAMQSYEDSQSYREQLVREDASELAQQNKMLPVSEIATLLGIHPNTVRIWTDSGVLKSYRIGPRKDRRIPLSVVRSFMEEM